MITLIYYYRANRKIKQKSETPDNPKQLYGDKKVPMQLNPPSALIYMAIGLREGAGKYGAWNYRESSIEAMTYIGAIQRHLAAFVDGEDLDTEGVLVKPHLAGAIASLAILIDAYEEGTLIDNRPYSRGLRSSAAALLRDYTLD